MNVEKQELIRNLKDTYARLEIQLNYIRREAEEFYREMNIEDGSPYMMQLPDGQYKLVPVLVAQANVLCALVSMGVEEID